MMQCWRIVNKKWAVDAFLAKEPATILDDGTFQGQAWFIVQKTFPWRR